MVYVHVPFCRSFCIYCDFYSEIAPSGSDFGLFVDVVCREIESRKEEIERSSGVNTLYFGGGTPSVLGVPDIARIASAVSDKPFREFTVEVNPEDVVVKGPEYVEGLLEAGVNRISMGVQSLDDGVLKWMGRRHDSACAREAFRILRDAGCDNISLDLIFGIGGMSELSLSVTLDEIIAMRPEHISAYQLSLEDGSLLEEMLEEGRYEEAPEENCAGQYGHICEVLRNAGYRHYEISNWALPGREAVHNSAYWSREPYVGVGPGAHSLMKWPDGRQERSWNDAKLSGWASSGEVLTPAQIREETIMLGLRREEGVEIDGVRRKIKESDWFVSDSIISGLL